MDKAKAAVSNLLHHDKQDGEHSSSHGHGAGTDSATGSTGSSSNDSPATQQGSRTLDGGANDGQTKSTEKSSEGKDLDETLEGPKDPAVQGEEHPEMKGEGQPGSHSALFGLTPDGKKEE